MGGSSLASLPVAQILPKELLSSWEREKPHCEDDIVRINVGTDSLVDISKKLEFGRLELSGVIGANWVSVSEGTRSASLCRSDVVFPWHYHPTGTPAFSFQDWLTFLLSQARISCLFTPLGISVYLKDGSHESTCLAERLKDLWANSQGKPNLYLLQAKRLLEDFVGLELSPDLSEASLAKGLGVYSECWIDHE